MDCRQNSFEIRWRTVGLCNGIVRRILAARSTSFTWNTTGSGLRYCTLTKPTPSLLLTVSNHQLSPANGSVRRLRNLAPYSSNGVAPFGEQRSNAFYQERLAVKPVNEPLTLLTLASFSKDQILQTLSDLRGEEITSISFRTTFLQYVQLCRLVHIQCKVQVSDSTQCLSCLQYAKVPFNRFKCDCLSFKFSNLQDCNCECGTAAFCCTCDELPQMCYDLDILSDIVNSIQKGFQALFIRTDYKYVDVAMRLFLRSECLGKRVLDVSTTIRLSQFEPP